MIKDNRIYYVRGVPTCDVYEICELVIRTATDDYCIGYDVDTKQAFYFRLEDDNVFCNRSEAEEYLQALKDRS